MRKSPRLESRFMVRMVAHRVAVLAIFVFALPSLAQETAAPSGAEIALAAEAQVGVTVHYDPSYVRLDYPGGDVPIDRGVCTDVVIRALREIGIDLQVRVHEDMRRDFRSYPNRWGLDRPDRNIDHRRVPNLMRWFERTRRSVAIDDPYEPGDIVAWILPNDLFHIGIVSTRRVPGTDRPMVVHNIGEGVRIEDVLYEFEILGHYRM